MAYSVPKHWRHMKVLLLFWGGCLGSAADRDGVHMGRGDYFYRSGCNMKQRPQSGCINNCFSQTRCLFTFHGDGLGPDCPWSTSPLYLILKKRTSWSATLNAKPATCLKPCHVTRPVLHLFQLLQPDLRLAMDYMNNASNSYSSGDTMSSSLANMTINDQHHQENGVQMGHRSPGDAKMKGRTNTGQMCSLNKVKWWL